MPWLRETSVALLTSHVRVEDCPRWIVAGSAENCEIAGLAGGGGGGGGTSFGGGGGGGGATFFLHPVDARNNVNPKSMTLIFRMLMFVLNLASC